MTTSPVRLELWEGSKVGHLRGEVVAFSWNASVRRKTYSLWRKEERLHLWEESLEIQLCQLLKLQRSKMSEKNTRYNERDCFEKKWFSFFWRLLWNQPNQKILLLHGLNTFWYAFWYYNIYAFLIPPIVDARDVYCRKQGRSCGIIGEVLKISLFFFPLQTKITSLTCFYLLLDAHQHYPNHTSRNIEMISASWKFTFSMCGTLLESLIHSHIL